MTPSGPDRNRKEIFSVNEQPDLAPLVRELRKRLRLTQEKFAARLGVTFPTINRWENGRVKPSPMAVEHLKDFVREMGKDGADLLKKYFGEE
jgi:DNA-binding transcriptional regulator YiaG